MDNQINPKLSITSHFIPAESHLSLDYFVNENKLLRNQIDFYQKELSNSKEAFFALERKYRISNEEKELMQNQIRNYEEIKQKSNESSQSLKEESMKLMDKLSNQRNEMQKMQLASESNTKLISDYKNQINSLNQHFSEKNGVVAQHLLTIDKLSSTKLELEKQISRMTNEISSMKYNQKQNEQLLQNQLKLAKENEQLAKIDKGNFQQKELVSNDSYSRLQNNYNILKQKHEALIEELNKQIRTLKEINQMKDTQLYQSDQLAQDKQNRIDELIESLNQINKTQLQIKTESNFLKEMINDKDNEIKRLNEFRRKYETIEFYDKSSIKSSQSNMSINDIDFIKDEYQKLRLMLNQAKFERDNLLSNNKLLNIKLKDYQELKTKSEETEGRLKDYSAMKTDFEKMQKEHNGLLVENKLYKEQLDIVSKQNRVLLLTKELNYSRTNPNYLSQSLKNDQYEQFLYNNIQDLESKMTNAIRSNIKYENEISELKGKLLNYSKDFEANNQLIKSMEEYVQGLEVVNLSQTKENKQMKSSLTSSFFIWNNNTDRTTDDNGGAFSNRRYSINDESSSLDLKIKELNIKIEELISKDQLGQTELLLLRKQLENETERNEKSLNDIMKLSNSIQDYNNQLAENNKEITVLVNKNSSLNDQLKEQSSIAIENERKINEKTQMVLMLQNDKNRLNQTIEGILKGNDEKINETKQLLEQNMKSIIEENKQMKIIIDYIQMSVKEIVKPLNKEIAPPSIEISNVKDKEIDDKSKSNANQKLKEYVELKEQIAQMKITIENISTENAMLKYKESIYNRKSAYLGYRIISQEKIHSHPQPQILQAPNEPQSSNNNNALTNASSIEENYLKVIKENKDLSSDILLLKTKITELTKINNELVSGNITGPYKAFINQIDELTKTVSSLKMQNANLLKEKESIISTYSFLNLTNESLKEKQTQLETINSSLIKETFSLTESLQNHSTKIEQLKKKEDIIQAKEKEINVLQTKTDDLYITINKLENERNEYTDHEKNLKEEIQLKQKEVFESKSKTFKTFYAFFNKSKSAICYLQKINEDIENKMNQLEKTKKHFNDKVNSLELKNVSMESMIKDKDKMIQKLQNENLYLKGLNTQMENDIKIIEAETKKDQPSAVTSPPRVNPNPPILKVTLLSRLKKAINLITYLKMKVAQLEKEKETSNANLSNEQSIEIVALKEEVKAHLMSLGNKDKAIQQLKSSLTQVTLQHEVISKDTNYLSMFIKENIQQIDLSANSNSNVNSSNTNTIINVEKMNRSKAFNLLITQMRKAIKIIYYLTKN